MIHLHIASVHTAARMLSTLSTPTILTSTHVCTVRRQREALGTRTLEATVGTCAPAMRPAHDAMTHQSHVRESTMHSRVLRKRVTCGGCLLGHVASQVEKYLSSGLSATGFFPAHREHVA